MLLPGGEVSEQFANKKDTKVNPRELTSHPVLLIFYTSSFPGNGSSKVRLHNGEFNGNLDGGVDDHEDVDLGK